jgi:putative restriction endonuclease
MSLEKFINKFQKLRIDKAHGIAPHKPILLLAIIRNFEENKIQENKIFITPELVATFKDIWSILGSEKHQSNFALPFFHLKSDGFWRLIPKIGYEHFFQNAGQMRSIKLLSEAIDFAVLDFELFDLLKNTESRKTLKLTLLNTYFPNKIKTYLSGNGNNQNFLENIEQEILESKAVIDEAKVQEDELFVRKGLFKRLVPKVYNFTCCISGLNITSLFDVAMIDACHIVPFSVSHDDSISNGISLCPNLHRAFDRGLITVDEKYQLLVSNSFVEANQSDYGIKKFEGSKILLPNDAMFFPSQSNFEWHRTHIFKS